MVYRIVLLNGLLICIGRFEASFYCKFGYTTVDRYQCEGILMPSNEMFAGTGISGLDEILGGGLPRAHLHLVRGPSGAGKTTLSLQFLIEGARNGETVLYIGTSETDEEIRGIASSNGWNLDGVTLHHHVSTRFGERQTMLLPAEVDLPQSVESILRVVDEVNPSRLVIDSLTEIRTLARERMWYRQQLMMVKQHFQDRQMTTLLLDLVDPDQFALNSIVTGVLELNQTVQPYGPDRRRVRVSKMRGRDFLSGYHDFRIRKGGIEVFPRLVAAASRGSFDLSRIESGIPTLDAAFQGGLVRGTSILLVGPSGTGKSVVATQCAVASAERGERAAMFIFDERVQTLFDRSEGIGLPLRKYVENGEIILRQIDPAEVSCGQLSHEIKRLVETKNVRMVLIDSLNGYAYAMPDERYLSIHLHEMSSYLNQLHATAIFTMTQHGLVSANEQPFDVSYIADSVVLFQLFEHGGRIHKAISVQKCRSAAHETSIREMRITNKGIELSDPLTQYRGILRQSPFLATDESDEFRANFTTD